MLEFLVREIYPNPEEKIYEKKNGILKMALLKEEKKKIPVVNND